jgi:hypothetical protein
MDQRGQVFPVPFIKGCGRFGQVFCSAVRKQMVEKRAENF